jgi:hypothetical protein
MPGSLPSSLPTSPQPGSWAAAARRGADAEAAAVAEGGSSRPVSAAGKDTSPSCAGCCSVRCADSLLPCRAPSSYACRLVLASAQLQLLLHVAQYCCWSNCVLDRCSAGAVPLLATLPLRSRPVPRGHHGQQPAQAAAAAQQDPSRPWQPQGSHVTPSNWTPGRQPGRFQRGRVPARQRLPTLGPFAITWRIAAREPLSKGRARAVGTGRGDIFAEDWMPGDEGRWAHGAVLCQPVARRQLDAGGGSQGAARADGSSAAGGSRLA